MSILDQFRLDGQVAIVTGASRGIGAAIAKALAEAGAVVYGVGRSQVEPGRAETVHYRRCDVRDAEAFAAVVTEVISERGRLDILVNAAGVTMPDQVETTPSSAFENTLAINLNAAYSCCCQVIAQMKAQQHGVIINVTSIGALLGFPGNPAYLASKAGLSAMSRGLALDLGADGIRVNNLVPGYVHTAMTDASFNDPERHAARAGRTMLGRWGQVDELASAAVFLASPASRYMTAADLVVDGGWSAKGL